jgi:hypothetical protein
MNGSRQKRLSARAAVAVAVLAGLGASMSAYGQLYKTETFSSDPGWIGVDNMLGNTDGLHPPGTQTAATPGHGTNFGWAPNLDSTGTAVLPPDIDGPGPFVPAASGPGEAGGGFANGRNPFPPPGGQSYYGDRIGPLNANMPLQFSGVWTFTENRDRMFLGFFNSFENDTTYGPAGTQPGPAQGGLRRPEFLGIEGDASSGIRVNLMVGRAKDFQSGGFNMSTANTLVDRSAFFAARNGVGPTIIPVPFLVKYDPNGGTGFGAISMTIPGATFNPLDPHTAVIRDETGPMGVPDGIDDIDLDGNDAPEDADTFTFALTQGQRNIMNTFVFDRFGMINGLRDQGAGDNGQDSFIDDVTYSVPEPAGAVVLGVFAVAALRARRRA